MLVMKQGRNNRHSVRNGIMPITDQIGGKEVLRDKKVSVDAAYKEVKSANQKPTTPKQQIDKLDKRINEIDKTIKSLQAEKNDIIKRRTSIFYMYFMIKY